MAIQSAFQANAFQNNAFQTVQPIVTTAGDFVDYIFQFPDQGSFLRDPVIQVFAPPVLGSQPGVQLLIFNPVENLQAPFSPPGNLLVFPPQLSNSSVALPGFWALITVKTLTGSLPVSLTSHDNIQIVNDRTLMFAQKPSVLQTRIDVSHINIIINIFGVYVRDGLQTIGGVSSVHVLLLEDAISDLLLEDAISELLLES